MTDLNGPLFNGQADRTMDAACQDIEWQVGETGEAMIRDHLAGVLKNPTGYYRSNIMAEPDGGDIAITDRDIIYGPWLEGIGSRNRTTRFKGYATFRRVRQALDSRAERIAQDVAQPYIGRIG